MAENNLLESGRLVYAKSFIIGGRSGLATGTIAVDASVFGLRNITNEELVVSQVELAFGTVDALPAAENVILALYKATAFTAIQTGGQALTPIRKRTGDHVVPPTTEIQAVIATTVALTGASFTVDRNSPIDVLVSSADGTGAASFASGRSVWTPGNRVPLSLGPDEGLVVLVDNLVLGAGTGRIYVAVDAHKA